MEKKIPREMTGAELKSMLKSSINFKSLGGVKCPEIKASPRELQWWRDAKIGMFIHWGLYSMLGRGEWVRHNEQIPKAEYERLAWEFKPEDFDMRELTGLAKDFGARYMVLVARHHDGFSLWNSPGSYEGFNSYSTGAGRDFVKEYVETCRKDGLRVGLYYSPMDWRFPGYFDPEGLPENAARMKKQCYDQVEELCSRYGAIDILWYDGGWLAHKGSDTSSAWFWEPVKLNRLAKSYNPAMLVNPRSGFEGDFYCDEGSHEIRGKIIPVPWEKNMCVCSGASWGWMADDPVSDFDWLIRMLVNVMVRDGNLLLNVGPDRNGKLSPEVAGRMRQIGLWLRRYSDSIYGTRGGPLEPVDGVYGTTYKEDTVYLHILDCRKFASEVLPAVDGKIAACNLYDGTPVKYAQGEQGLRIQLPENLAEEPDTIVKIRLETPVANRENHDIYFTGKG